MNNDNLIKGGATLWARQTIESEIFSDKPDKWFKIWFFLVSKAKFNDDDPAQQRGSCFMRYDWIMEGTKATRAEVDHCIRFLKSATMIATAKATRGFIVTICNYSTYQNLDNYKSDNKSDNIGDTKATQKRHKSDTILKNDKNDKNDKNVDIKKENIVKEKKDRFLDFVLLTKNEYKKLIERFGKTETEERIERLNNYLGSKGVRYKSHYHTILNWANKDKKEGGNNKPKQVEDKYTIAIRKMEMAEKGEN